MPPKQRRKRKLVEADADDAQSNSGPVGETQKKRSRRGRIDKKSNVNGRHDVGVLENGPSSLPNNVRVAVSINNRQSAIRAVSTSPPPRSPTQRPVVAAATSGRRVSLVSQHVRLAQDSTPNDTSLQSDHCDRRVAAVSRDEDILCNNDAASPDQCSTANANYEHNHNHHANAYDRERRKLKLFLLFWLVAYFIIIGFTCSAIIYTQYFNHNLTILEMVAFNSLSSERQSEAIKREKHKYEQTFISLKTAYGHIEDCQKKNIKLGQELATTMQTHNMQIQEYKAIFQQHDKELIDAMERIKVLRGGKDESSAIDLAWLRMDELMEENDELSNDLKKARHTFNTDVARIKLRDRELINAVESLTRQLDNLQHNHNEISDSFLAPILVYIQKLQRTSGQQHSIILDLTSLVHSLQSSLEISQENLEMQSTESMHAVDAIVVATNAFHEIERTHYIEHTDLELKRLEDEAMGAVQAVAEAAGRLEYERKIEEEGRWRSYVAETETVLKEIRQNIHEESVHDNLKGVGKTSVLRAALSRRIEEGMASLRSYIHPYNYLQQQSIEDDQSKEDGV